jgi:hypothetical protein
LLRSPQRRNPAPVEFHHDRRIILAKPEKSEKA